MLLNAFKIVESRMDFKEKGFCTMKWLYSAQDRDCWKAFLKSC